MYFHDPNQAPDAFTLKSNKNIISIASEIVR